MNFTTSTSVNTSSDFSILGPLWMRVIAAIVAIATTAVGGIGNVTVLLAFLANRNLWTKQNIYLFCLTISDLAVATLVVSVRLDQYLTGRWRYSHALCRAYQIFTSMAYISSLNFIALISRDRLLMVVKGSNYENFETPVRKWLYVGINIVGLSVLLIPYHSYDIFTGFSLYFLTGRCYPEQLQSLYVTIANQLVFTMLPFLFMLYYYAGVRKYLRKKRSTILPTQLGRSVIAVKQPRYTIHIVWTLGTTPFEKTRRAVKIMNVLLVSVFLCAMPATVMSLFMNVLMANPALVTPPTLKWWNDLYGLVFFFCYIANAVNPILYAYAMPSYKDAIRNVARMCSNLLHCK